MKPVGDLTLSIVSLKKEFAARRSLRNWMVENAFEQAERTFVEKLLAPVLEKLQVAG